MPPPTFLVFISFISALYSKFIIPLISSAEKFLNKFIKTRLSSLHFSGEGQPLIYHIYRFFLYLTFNFTKLNLAYQYILHKKFLFIRYYQKNSTTSIKLS